MSWTQLQQLLLEAPLDKEVKLMAIDALSLTTDQTIKNELIKLLLEWRASDKRLVEEFQTELGQIVATSDQRADELDKKEIIKQTSLADEIGKEAAMDKLKKHIATL